VVEADTSVFKGGEVRWGCLAFLKGDGDGGMIAVRGRGLVDGDVGGEE